MSRTTGKMLDAMKELGDGYELLLIGESEEEDEEIVRQTILMNGLTNVKILPRMDQDHLKYFIDQSQVGMVTYHQRDLNNKYCASGKIFEFLYEGKPVVTSTNPPFSQGSKRCTSASNRDGCLRDRTASADAGSGAGSISCGAGL